MKTEMRGHTSHLAARIAAGLLVAVCLVLGAVGLVLPIIPGLVFLAVAAVIVVRWFPRLGVRLRRHPSMGPVIDRTDRFLELPWPRMLQCGGLVCLKLALDGLELVSAAVARLLGRASSRRAI